MACSNFIEFDLWAEKLVLSQHLLPLLAGRRPLTLPPAPHRMFWTSVYPWSGWWLYVGSRAGCVWIRISWVFGNEILYGFCGFLSRPGGLWDCFSIQCDLGSLGGRRFWWWPQERYNRELGFKGCFSSVFKACASHIVAFGNCYGFDLALKFRLWSL